MDALSGIIGGKGSQAAAMAQHQAYANSLAQQQAFQIGVQLVQAPNPYANVAYLINSSQPVKRSKLEAWWENLQRRGRELGEDDMSYAEWSNWMDQLDEFREAARG